MISNISAEIIQSMFTMIRLTFYQCAQMLAILVKSKDHYFRSLCLHAQCACQLIHRHTSLCLKDTLETFVCRTLIALESPIVIKESVLQILIMVIAFQLEAIKPAHQVSIAIKMEFALTQYQLETLVSLMFLIHNADSQQDVERAIIL